LSDEVIVLRPWSSSDASFMLEASKDPAIDRYNRPTPDSLAEAISVIDRIGRSWHAFAVEGDPNGIAFTIVEAVSGEPVGMCGIDNWSSTNEAQFGYWLAAGARGRGLATRAVRLMTGWLFELGAARVRRARRRRRTRSDHRVLRPPLERGQSLDMRSSAAIDDLGLSSLGAVSGL
jgi:RimJ/RimL family protein N-acetyltransferase